MLSVKCDHSEEQSKYSFRSVCVPPSPQTVEAPLMQYMHLFKIREWSKRQ